MSSEYTPTNGEVRAMYVNGTPVHRVSVEAGNAEFDRWLAGVCAEAKAEALTDLVADLDKRAKLALSSATNDAQIGSADGLEAAATIAHRRAAQLKETK